MMTMVPMLLVLVVSGGRRISIAHAATTLVIMLTMTVALVDEPVHAGEHVSILFISGNAVFKTSETASVKL